MQRVRIVDIARELGVSTATVSGSLTLQNEKNASQPLKIV